MRNHKMLFIFCGLLSLTSANAQQKPEYTLNPTNYVQIDNTLFSCIYTYKIAVRNPEQATLEEETCYTILQVGNNSAKFWDYTAYQEDSLLLFGRNVTEEMKKEAQDKTRRAMYFFEGVIFQNHPKGKMTVTDIITPNYFTYTQPADALEWELSGDTLTVCGHLCHKATTSYAGREWTAWYALDIPSPLGPWKLTGLPGIILQAEDREGVHLFTATAIRQAGIPVYEQKNARQIRTTREKFLRNKIGFEKDPMKNVPMEGITNIDVLKVGDQSMILIDGLQLRIRPNGYTPLELQ